MQRGRNTEQSQRSTFDMTSQSHQQTDVRPTADLTKNYIYWQKLVGLGLVWSRFHGVTEAYVVVRQVVMVEQRNWISNMNWLTNSFLAIILRSGTIQLACR